jgi:hypothetical protein
MASITTEQSGAGMPLFLRDELEEDISNGFNSNSEDIPPLNGSANQVDHTATNNADMDRDMDMLLGIGEEDVSSSKEPLSEGGNGNSVEATNGMQAASTSSSYGKSRDALTSIPRDNPASSDYASSPPRSSPPIISRKRQRASTGITAQKEWYLGSFLVSNAWSTAKGSGYVKPGDEILIERDTLQKIADGKTEKIECGGKKQKGKQMTLNAMFKAQSKPKQIPNVSKKAKTNNVVRLTNTRGFGTFYSTKILPLS